MSVENRLKTLAGLSSLWDAKLNKPITRIRSADKTLALYGRRVALHLMIQESVYSELNQQSLYESQGFLPRCLITFPESMAGKRPYAAADPTKAPEVRRFWDQCNRLLDRPLPTVPPPAPANQLEPRTLTLSEEAYQHWILFHNQVDREAMEGHIYHSIRRFASKAPDYALRIAGVLTLFEDPDADRVKLPHIERAIAIMNYYLRERLRLACYHSIDPRLLTAQKVLDWAKSKEKQVVTLRELYQYGPTEVRSRDKALAIMRILESHNRAIPETPPKAQPGAKVKAWRLIF